MTQERTSPENTAADVVAVDTEPNDGANTCDGKDSIPEEIPTDAVKSPSPKRGRCVNTTLLAC